MQMKQTAETYGAVLHTDLCQLTEHLSALQLCDLLCHQTATPLSYQRTLSGTHRLQGMENLIRVWKGLHVRWQRTQQVSGN